MTRIEGKRTLIAGAAMGMGMRMAERFGTEGAELVLVDVNELALEALSQRLRGKGMRVHHFVCDLSQREQEIEGLVAKVHKTAGPIDILVNNAGVVTGGVYEEIPAGRDALMLDVNVAALHWMTKAFLPDMKRAGAGHIVQLASAASFLGVPEQVVYCASKWFVVGVLSEALRVELAQQGHHGIRLTIVCPSFVNTGMFEGVKAPFLTPMLEPDFVVDRVIEAVHHNRLYVKEPFVVKTTSLLRALLPARCSTVSPIASASRARCTAGRATSASTQSLREPTIGGSVLVQVPDRRCAPVLTTGGAAARCACGAWSSPCTTPMPEEGSGAGRYFVIPTCQSTNA